MVARAGDLVRITGERRQATPAHRVPKEFLVAVSPRYDPTLKAMVETDPEALARFPGPTDRADRGH